MPFSSTALLAALSGLALGLSLISALGAQNVFVLRQGVKIEHVGIVVGICTLSDLVLIAAGTGGAGVVVDRWPNALTIARLAAAVFLAGYGILAARRAWRPTAVAGLGALPPTPMVQTVLTCLAFTWLNPHVYLDTVVLLGSIAQTHDRARWWFALGAGIGDLAWFVALGYSARLLRPLLSRGATWRFVDGLIAVVMLGLAGLLLIQG